MKRSVDAIPEGPHYRKQSSTTSYQCAQVTAPSGWMVLASSLAYGNYSTKD